MRKMTARKRNAVIAVLVFAGGVCLWLLVAPIAEQGPKATARVAGSEDGDGDRSLRPASSKRGESGGTGSPSTTIPALASASQGQSPVLLPPGDEEDDKDSFWIRKAFAMSWGGFVERYAITDRQAQRLLLYLYDFQENSHLGELEAGGKRRRESLLADLYERASKILDEEQLRAFRLVPARSLQAAIVIVIPGVPVAELSRCDGCVERLD